ncbi:MAG: hypothetical protein ACYTDT_01665 [Planctomycetota bacterium]|jgi:hypothetical protein
MAEAYLQPNPANRRKATMALLSVCIFWGATFSWINAGTDAIKSHYGAEHVIACGTFFVLARMVVGAVLMPLVIPASIKRMNKQAVKMGFLLSLPFAAGFILQNVGLAYPDLLPAQSAFFLWTTLWSLLVMVFTPNALGIFAPEVLGLIVQDSKFLINIALCGLLATAVAISVLNRWQKELTPTRAAIIYTAEPVFASLYSMFISEQDVFSWWLVFGASMILLANLSAEFLRKRGGKPAKT